MPATHVSYFVVYESDTHPIQEVTLDWGTKTSRPTVPLRGPRKTKGSWEKYNRSIDSKHDGAFVSAPTLSGRVAVLFEREEQWHFNASNRACGLGVRFIGGLPR